MPLVNFSNLNFDQIKTSIKDYLKANSNFTDYDFEGSNLSTIIDTLAFNTYITSYNANMATNEVFIDGATLRENIVSLARNIGYVPRSRKSSTVNVSFNVDVSSTSAVSVTLKAGSVLTSRQTGNNEGTNFIFSIVDEITVPVDSNGNAFFNNIDVYEGTYIEQDFTVDVNYPNQEFILDNAGIDTSLISVYVKATKDDTVKEKYTLFDSLFTVGPTSRVYFIQEKDGERYELLFGDGVFGKALENNNYINARYITGSGDITNSISAFAFIGVLRDNNGAAITTGISPITTNIPSYGGQEIETVESVKKYAPLIYASQNRAVTSADYEAIVPQIYPETESVSAFGGEDLNPPSYGKVFVSVKPFNGVFLSSDIKQNIKQALKQYSVAGIVPEIVDLKYLYVETQSDVYYNTNLTSGPTAIKDVVLKNIYRYSDSIELNKFGARFKYSKYQKIIDDSNEAITSNITTVDMRRDMEALLNTFAEYELCFGNRFYVKNHGHSAVNNGTVIGYNIKSSGFTVAGISGTVYLGDMANPGLRNGTVFLFKLISPEEPVIVRRNIGSIDYLKGEIKLNPINIISTRVNTGTPLVEVSASPYSNDVIGLQDLYIQLDISTSSVTVLEDNIASNNDLSGSNYIVSSSYSNGSLVRGTPITTVDSTTSINTTTRTVQPTSTSTGSIVNRPSY
jgi:hypothetical protein